MAFFTSTPSSSFLSKIAEALGARTEFILIPNIE